MFSVVCVCVCVYEHVRKITQIQICRQFSAVHDDWLFCTTAEQLEGFDYERITPSFFRASLFFQLQQILTRLQQTSCQPTEVSLSYNIFYIVLLHICVKCNLVLRLKFAFLIDVHSHNWCREIKGKTLKTAARIFQFSLCKKDQLTSKDSKQALVNLLFISKSVREYINYFLICKYWSVFQTLKPCKLNNTLLIKNNNAIC